MPGTTSAVRLPVPVTYYPHRHGAGLPVRRPGYEDADAAALTGVLRQYLPDTPAVPRQALDELLFRGRTDVADGAGGVLTIVLTRRMLASGSVYRPEAEAYFTFGDLGLEDFDDLLVSSASDPHVASALAAMQQLR